MIGTILLVVLVLALLGGMAPFGAVGGRPFYGSGYYGGGGIGLIIVVVLVLLLFGRF